MHVHHLLHSTSKLCRLSKITTFRSYVVSRPVSVHKASNSSKILTFHLPHTVKYSKKNMCRTAYDRHSLLLENHHHQDVMCSPSERDIRTPLNQNANRWIHDRLPLPCTLSSPLKDYDNEWHVGFETFSCKRRCGYKFRQFFALTHHYTQIVLMYQKNNSQPDECFSFSKNR
jgi:hypothetical protein